MSRSVVVANPFTPTMCFTTETEQLIDGTYLDTWYGGRTEVTCANNVVTNVVSLFEEAELSNFTVRVCYVVQTCNLRNNSLTWTGLQQNTQLEYKDPQ